MEARASISGATRLPYFEVLSYIGVALALAVLPPIGASQFLATNTRQKWVESSHPWRQEPA